MSCNLCDLGFKSIAQLRPVGSMNPDVYVVLDKPNDDELRLGDLTKGIRGQYLINALMSVGLSNYRVFSLIRCSCNEDPTEEELEQCKKFITSDIYRSNPKVIITSGALATQTLLGIKDKITNARGLVKNLEISGKKFPVVPIYSPTYVINKYGNSEIIGEFMGDLATASKIVTGEYLNPMDRNILEYALDYDTFYDFYKGNLKDEEMLAYDIETNAKLVYSKDFDICGWSLAKEGIGIYVCLDALDYNMPEPDRQQCIDLLLKILKDTPKIVVHNSLYERPATYFRYGYELPFEKIEDTLVMAKIMLGGKIGAGLKPNARRIGYPEWDKDLAQYIEGFTKAIKRSSLKRFQPIIQELRDGATFDNVFEKLDDHKYDEIQEFYEKGIRDSVLRYYSEDEFEELVPEISKKFVEGYDNGFTQVIPYSWVPERMLCKYGATDSLATFDLYNYFLKRFDEDSTDEVDLHKGYYYDLMEHNTGYELMLAGIHWDDDSATRDYKVYSTMMLKSLRAMILCNHPAMNEFILRKFIPSLAPKYIYENYNDYFWEHYQNRIEMKDESTYVMVDISPTTGKERRRDTKFFFNDTDQIPETIKKDLLREILPKAKELIDEMDMDELKGIFNPASTVKVISDTYNNIVLDDDLRVGNFINKLRDNILKSEEIDRSTYTEDEQQLLDYVEKYLEVPTNEVENRRVLYEPLKSYILSLTRMTSKDMQEYLGDMHNFRLDGLSEGSQLEVFESLRTTPIDIDDPNTWTDPFKWNFYLRMYKKSSKIITAYLDGSVGRGSVYAVNKAKLQSGDDLVYREEPMEELGTTDYRGNLPDGDDWLEQTSFGVGTAETGRWRCLSGDTKVLVVGEGYVPIEDLYDDHRYGFKVGSVNVHNGSKVIGICTGIAITGRDTPMVRVTTVTKYHFDCTPEHKVLMNDRSYKRACDLHYGDVLYNDVVVGDIEKIDNSDVVYDLSVDGFHNFTIEGNIIVHNSAYHVIPAGSTVKRLMTSRYPGGTIFQPDFSANELRCVASAAHEESMLQAFRDGIDIHKSNAARMFGVPMEEITPFQRRWAKTMCLTGDTKVRLLRGISKTIEELYNEYITGTLNEYVYSYHDELNKFIPCKLLGVEQNREETEYVEIELDNGAVIHATKDHPFVMRDGSEKLAEELVAGDSLMAMYFDESEGSERRGSGKGYEIFNDPDGSLVFTHKRVAEFVELDSKVDDSYRKIDIHHIDYNKRNNHPDNLKLLDSSEHLRQHRNSDTIIIGNLVKEELSDIDKYSKYRAYNSTDHTTIEEYIVELLIVNKRHHEQFIKKLKESDPGIRGLVADILHNEEFMSKVEEAFYNSFYSKAQRRGSYANNGKNFTEWTSEKREAQAKRAKDNNRIEDMWFAKHIHYIKQLLDNGYEFNRENYDRYRPHATYYKYENLEELLGKSYEELESIARMLPKEEVELQELDTSTESEMGRKHMDEMWNADTESAKAFREKHSKVHRKMMSESNKDPELNIIRSRNKIMKVLKEMMSVGITDAEIIQEGMEKSFERLVEITGNKHIGYPKRLGKYFDSTEEAVEAAKKYNHKVKSVRIIRSDVPIKFYGLMVNYCHNFLIDTSIEDDVKNDKPAGQSGIFSVNSFMTLYGGSAPSLARDYFNGDMKRAQEQLDSFYGAFPGLSAWIESKHDEVMRTHKVSTLAHRFINIDFDPNDQKSVAKALRASSNYPIQNAASVMAAVIFCDILLYMKKHNFKSKGICFIHDSLESDIYPYELIELTKYQQKELATGAIDYFGIECKADVSMGYSMGHECEMTEIEILDDEYTKAYITLEGFYNDILDTLNHWKLAYHKVEIVEEDLHDQYLSVSEMFIARKAFDPTAMNHHKQGKVKIYIQYYNDKGEIEPMTDHFEPINIWDNAPVYKYVMDL